MSTSKPKLINKLEKFLQHPEGIWHKILVYIFYNTKHEERRRRVAKQIGKSFWVQLAQGN